MISQVLSKRSKLESQFRKLPSKRTGAFRSALVLVALWCASGCQSPSVERLVETQKVPERPDETPFKPELAVQKVRAAVAQAHLRSSQTIFLWGIVKGFAGLPAPGALPVLDKVAVPAGAFWSGCAPKKKCSDSVPAGKEKSLGAYSIDRTEITVEAYSKCVAARACALPKPPTQTSQQWGCNWNHPERIRHPMNCINYAQASRFCRWVGGRLPTSDEWEKAARGMDGRTYPWGEDDPLETHAVQYSSTTGPVDSKPDGASPYGVLGTMGNVQEWTSTPDFHFVPHLPNRYVVRGVDYLNLLEPGLNSIDVLDIALKENLSTALGFRCAYSP